MNGLPVYALFDCDGIKLGSFDYVEILVLFKAARRAFDAKCVLPRAVVESVLFPSRLLKAGVTALAVIVAIVRDRTVRAFPAFSPPASAFGFCG